MIDGYIFGSRFTMGAHSAMVDHLYFYHEHTGTPDNYARGAIYTVNGDRPGTLIKETDLQAITTSSGWIELTFPVKPGLTAGTEYFFLIWINESATGISTTRYSIPGGNQGFTKNMGAGPVGNFPSTISGGAVRSYRFSMYATYDIILATITNDLKNLFWVGQDSRDLKGVFRTTQEILHAEFRLRQETFDLPAEFITRLTGTQDLKALLEVMHIGTQDLFAEFIVRQKASLNIFAELTVIQLSANLLGEFIVRHTGIYDLPNETVIRHSASLNLAAEFITYYSGTLDLEADFMVRHSASRELYACFWVGGSADLKAEFYLPTRRNKDAYYPIILDDIDWWLNYLHLDGKGFIGWPTFEKDTIDKREGQNSLKITSEEVQKGYKEVTFGWLYEPVDLTYWQQPPCALGKEFELIARDDWDWDEEETYIELDAATYLLADAFLRLEYNTNFGAGGMYYHNVNYGTASSLRLTRYDWYYYGELPSQFHFNVASIVMKWDLSDPPTMPDLSRLAWARLEMYRHGGPDLAGFRAYINRFDDCEDIPQRYVYANPANLIGGCNPKSTYGGVPYTSTGKYYEDIWQETTIKYEHAGLENHLIGGLQYIGNEGFRTQMAQNRSVTWEKDVWDKFKMTALLRGWLDGTYNNHGMEIEGTYYPGRDQRLAILAGGELLYYGRYSADPRKPKIILQFWPQGKEDEWEFTGSFEQWEINRDDPYSGSGSLHLGDWSKASYEGVSEANRPRIKPRTDKQFIEGMVETVFRLNQEEWKHLIQDPAFFSGGPYQVIESGNEENMLTIYFRYQDEDNHYRVQFRLGGPTNSRIQKTVGGNTSTLNTFEGKFGVGKWSRIRIIWNADPNDGNCKICVYKYDEEQDHWRYLAGSSEAIDWVDGGEVLLESFDCDLDETKIWEVV